MSIQTSIKFMIRIIHPTSKEHDVLFFATKKSKTVMNHYAMAMERQEISTSLQ